MKRTIILSGLMFLVLTTSIIFTVKATTSLVGTDKTSDLWKFDYSYLDEISDDLIDDDDFDSDSANKIFDKLYERKDDKAENVGNPDMIDIRTIDFDLESYEIIITVNDDIEFTDNELGILIIWSDENIYFLVMFNESYMYFNLNNDTYNELKIDNREMSFHTAESSFNDQEYVRALFIYFKSYKDNQEAIIDFYSNEFSMDGIYWFFQFIIILIIIIIIIIIIVYIYRSYKT